MRRVSKAIQFLSIVALVLAVGHDKASNHVIGVDGPGFALVDKNTHHLLDQANEELDAGNLELAAALAQEAFEKDAYFGDQSLRNTIAQKLFEGALDVFDTENADNYRETRYLFDVAARINPTNAIFNVTIAQKIEELNQTYGGFGSSGNFWENAYRAEPKNIFYLAGYALNGAISPEERRELAEKAIEQGDESGMAHQALGMLLIREAIESPDVMKALRARDHFVSALRQGQANGELYYWLVYAIVQGESEGGVIANGQGPHYQIEEYIEQAEQAGVHYWWIEQMRIELSNALR